MNIEEYRDFCLSLPGATECTPFDEDTIVFKVGAAASGSGGSGGSGGSSGSGGRMFSYAGMAGFCRFCVKCDPDLALELREQYPEVTRGIHSNSVHWNTIRVDGELTDAFLREQIRHSYNLVVAKLPVNARP